MFKGNTALQDAEDNGGAAHLNTTDVIVRRCWFEGNEAGGRGGGLELSATGLGQIEDCVFVDNRSRNGAAVWAIGLWRIERCTFYANETTSTDGAAVEVDLSNFGLNQCIIAGTVNGYGLGVLGSASTHCFCFWNNERGPAFGGVNRPASYGNFEGDPMFCSTETNDFHLEATSPCLPQEHGGYMCELIGAYGAGCGVSPVVPTSWGRIKARFRGEAKEPGDDVRMARADDESPGVR